MEIVNNKIFLASDTVVVIRHDNWITMLYGAAQ